LGLKRQSAVRNGENYIMNSFLLCNLHLTQTLFISGTVKSMRKRLTEHRAWIWEAESSYKISARKCEGKRPFGRPGSRWEETIKINLMKIRYGNVTWTQMTEDRIQWRTSMRNVMKLRVPLQRRQIS
jgi:hypothetical protein